MATDKPRNRKVKATPGTAKPVPAAAPRAQDSRHEDWQHYFEFFNLAPVAYLRLDRFGSVEEINEAGARMLGSRPDAVIGHPLVAFVSRDSRYDFLEHMRQCRARDVVVETDLSLSTHYGVTTPVRVYSKRSQRPKRDTFWTMLIDLTERRRLEAAREQAENQRVRAEQEERLGRMTTEATHRFLNVLSHELRTPLTPALFAASRLAEKDMPDAVRRLGAIIQRNIQIEASLIDDLLDVSRIERGRLAMVLQPTDLHEVVLAAIDQCHPLLGSKRVTIQVSLRAQHHVVSGDSGRLRQVCANLLTNAIKFTDFGEIEISTENDEAGALRMTVRDTGIGLEEENVEVLFRSFEQHRGPSSRGGLGLGLTICKGVVEAHNGRIWASSSGPGCGSTFEVELETVDGDPLEPLAPEPPAAPLQTALRILVVEDDADTASVLLQLLTDEGHDLEIVHAVNEARRRAGESWDVVISDLGLPDGNGVEVARHFRRLDRPPRLIALSGFGNDADQQASAEAGFVRHLVKPISLKELRRALA